MLWALASCMPVQCRHQLETHHVADIASPSPSACEAAVSNIAGHYCDETEPRQTLHFKPPAAHLLSALNATNLACPGVTLQGLARL